jgi:glutamine synthetase type III
MGDKINVEDIFGKNVFHARKDARNGFRRMFYKELVKVMDQGGELFDGSRQCHRQGDEGTGLSRTERHIIHTGFQPLTGITAEKT